MRTLTAVLLSIALTGSAFAETPLAPGKPAGVNKAQMEHGTLILLGGAAIVAAGIAIAVSNDNNSTTPATATTTATTTTTS